MNGPDIPDWIKTLRADRWANIFDILPDAPRLTGVDAYCGDWNAHTLVLGKDCAPARVFRERKRENVPDPYRHDPTLHTNRVLCEALQHVGIHAPLDGSQSKNCGVFYANAFFLLRDDDRFSGALPNRRPALEQSTKVLRFILEHQNRLERIIAMGEDAYRALGEALSFESDWRKNLVERRHVRAEGWTIIASSHLGSRGLRNRSPGSPREECMRLILADWRAAF